MKSFVLCSLLIIAAASALQARPAPLESPLPADHSIEQVLPVNLFVEAEAKPTVKPTKPLSAYDRAYAAAQDSGRLVVLVCAKGCRPCKPAKEEFEKLAEGRADCVMLDLDEDEHAREILVDGGTFPAVVVFERRDDGWHRLTYGGTAHDIRTVLQPAAAGAAMMAPECLGCKSCPDDCAAAGCHCQSASSTHESGSCGVGCRRPLRNAVAWVAEHKPVRKAVAGVAIGVCKIGKAVAWRATHPLGGRFRGCR
jgi:hypothetical protein